MVVNRSIFTGIQVRSRSAGDGGTNITTLYYSVLLHRNGSFVVRSVDGQLLFSSTATPPKNLLHWSV